MGIKLLGITRATSSGDCDQARKKNPAKAVEGKERIIPDTLLLDFSARNVNKVINPPPTKKLTTN